MVERNHQAGKAIKNQESLGHFLSAEVELMS